MNEISSLGVEILQISILSKIGTTEEYTCDSCQQSTIQSIAHSANKNIRAYNFSQYRHRKFTSGNWDVYANQIFSFNLTKLMYLSTCLIYGCLYVSTVHILCLYLNLYLVLFLFFLSLSSIVFPSSLTHSLSFTKKIEKTALISSISKEH